MPTPPTPPKPAAPAPPDAGKDAPPFVVTNVKPRLIEIAGLRIGPTQTVEIPPQHAEGVRKSSVFRAGYLVEGRPQLPPSAPIDLTKLDVDKAKKLIAVEDDVSILTIWIDAEKRPDVVAALQERVKAL